eukprot:431473_1
MNATMGAIDLERGPYRPPSHRTPNPQTSDILNGDYSQDVTRYAIMRRMDTYWTLTEHSKAVLANDVASELDSTEEADYCGSCGAEDREGQCCNTWEDVTLTYHKRGWTLMNDVNQVP